MDFLLTEGLRPFSLLAGFIVVLLVAELVLMMVGLSSAVEVDGVGGDADAGLDLEPPEFDGPQLSAQELALLDLSPSEQRLFQPQRPSAFRRILQLLGIGKGPLLVSLTCLAAGVSACGYALQITLNGLTGAMLPATPALLIAVIPGLLLGGRIANLAARLVPSFESHAVSGQSYNGRQGHVVIGTASRGEPAQIRWRDMHGTTHSLMAEPLRDDDRIPSGVQVLIVKTRDRQPRIIALSNT